MSNQLQVSGEAKIRAIQGPVVANSGVITALDGDASEYVRGDGTLADFPTSTGGGSSVSYYLNTSVSQGTIGGVAYKQLSKTPISGAGTDVTISANGYVASYITDSNDPALLEVPAGNFNCEFYFSVNSNSHNPYVYAELYKYDGTTFTLLGSNVAIPQYLTNGTTLSAYYFAIPVATSVLTVTDRISIRIYVNVDGRTVTLHTENNHLCQVVTTFSKGLISLNNLTRQNQFFQTGTSGTDFAISSATATHTFNLPVASATNTGKLSSTDWSTFNNKQATISLTTTGSSGAATLVGATLNIPNYGSALSSYVPYTGATADVDLGVYNFKANIVSIASAGGSNQLTSFANTNSLHSASAGLNVFGFNTSNNIYFGKGLTGGGLGNGGVLIWSNTQVRYYTLPDADGTLALVGGSGVGTVTSVAALTLGTTGTDLSSSVANSTTTPVITLNVPTASATNRGALSSADWTTFNNKASTADLANYLPLAGGTLTGALNGTSAVFSSTVQASAYRLTGMTGGSGALYWTSDRVTLANYNATGVVNIEANGGTSVATFGGATYNNDFVGTGRFTGALTSAALLSSGTSGSGGQEAFRINNDNGYIGFFNTSNTTRSGYLQGNTTDVTLTTSLSTPLIFGTANVEKMRISSGGNVGIGTTSPDQRLVLQNGTSEVGIKLTDGTNNTFFAHAAANNNYGNGVVAGDAVVRGSNGISFTPNNGSATAMRITSGNNVLIGTNVNATSPEILQVYGNIQFATGGITKIVESWGLNLQGDTTHPVKVNSAALLLGTSSNSSWTAGQGYKSGGGSWADSSDVRLKENIKTVENALDKITKLRGVTFDWKDEFVGDRDKSSGGFIAQEMQQIFPEFIQERGANDEEKELINSDTIKTIYLPFSFSAYLVEAIKELSQQNQDLKARLDNAGL